VREAVGNKQVQDNGSDPVPLDGVAFMVEFSAEEKFQENEEYFLIEPESIEKQCGIRSFHLISSEKT
jgi:hypothetical protein